MPAITSNTPDPASLPGYIADDHLVIDGAPVAIPATLSAGALPRGTVLGKLVADGSYVLCDRTPVSGAPQTDGRQTPVAVLATPPNAVTGQPAMIYPAGQFNPVWLIWHESWTMLDVVNAMRPAGLVCFFPSGFGAPGNL